MSNIRHFMNIVEGRTKIAEQGGGFNATDYFRYLKHLVLEIMNLKKQQSPKSKLVEKYKEMLSVVNNAKIQGKSLPPQVYAEMIKRTNELVKQVGISTDQTSQPAPAPATPAQETPNSNPGPEWKSQKFRN